MEILQLEFSIHTPFAHTAGLIGCQCCVYALPHAKRLCALVSVCVWASGRGVRGMQVNSLRRANSSAGQSRASLDSHTRLTLKWTCLANEWTSEGWVEGRDGGGFRWVHTAAAAPARPSCRSAYISHRWPSSLCLWLFSFSPLSVTLSFSQRALSIRLYISLSPPISVVHSHSCNPIVLLESSLFLNWLLRLSSRCFDRVLSSYAHRQWRVKKMDRFVLCV